MSNDDYPVVFADGLLDVSHANGVFRISFGEQEGEGKVKLVGKIMIPGNQIGPVVQQISAAVNDIAGKLQKKTVATRPAAKAPARKTPAKRAKAPMTKKRAVAAKKGTVVTRKKATTTKKKTTK